MQHKANIYISSDGGCRVNEGISSTGWVVRAVGWDMHGTTKVIELASGGTFFKQSCSSFQIEAYAMNEVTNVVLQLFNNAGKPVKPMPKPV